MRWRSRESAGARRARRSSTCTATSRPPRRGRRSSPPRRRAGRRSRSICPASATPTARGRSTTRSRARGARSCGILDARGIGAPSSSATRSAARRRCGSPPSVPSSSRRSCWWRPRPPRRGFPWPVRVLRTPMLGELALRAVDPALGRVRPAPQALRPRLASDGGRDRRRLAAAHDSGNAPRGAGRDPRRSAALRRPGRAGPRPDASSSGAARTACCACGRPSGWPPGCRARDSSILPDAGHLPQREVPRAFSEAVAGFLGPAPGVATGPRTACGSGNPA